MEPTLLAIGLNHCTAPVALRERFWISKGRRCDALAQLAQAEGIEEAVVLTTCDRTEFLLWANEAGLAENSVLRFLTAEYGLKLCEWKHFYRLLDDAALLHIFRVASSLDSMVLGEPRIVHQVEDAWRQAQRAGSTARFLDAVLQKALSVSQRVQNETAMGKLGLSLPYAAVQQACRTLGTLTNKRVLVLGAGKMSELAARLLVSHGATSVCVTNRTFEHALKLAAALPVMAAPFEERRHYLVDSDVVISATSSPHPVLSREEAESIARERPDRPWVLVDLALPRDIDPGVREVEGILLYDLDDLGRVVARHAGQSEAAALDAQRIVEDEARGFCRKLLSERAVSTVMALRSQLQQICRQELESFKQECGPFSKDQNALLEDVMVRMTLKIAGSLARELKELPEKGEPDQLTAAIRRLFHLEAPEKAAVEAGH